MKSYELRKCAMECKEAILNVNIGVGDAGRALALPPPPEINSGKFEIIRALNFDEDLF